MSLTSTISNTTTDLNGNVVPNVTVLITLAPPGGFRVDDHTEVAPQYTTTSNGSGFWSVSLERNSNITPTGSYYVAQEQYPASAGGYREYAFTVGAVNATLAASILAATPPTPTVNYLTQAQADARYALIGTAQTGNFVDIGAPTGGDDTGLFTAAIGNAPAAGATLMLRTNANYQVSTLSFDLAGTKVISIFGAGPNVSKITLTGAGVGIQSIRNSMAEFRNFSIVGGASTTTCLEIRASSYCRVSNVFIDNRAAATVVGCEIRNNTTTDTGGSLGSYYNTFEGVRIEGQSASKGDTALRLKTYDIVPASHDGYVNANTFVSCRFSNQTNQNVDINYAHGNFFHGGSCENSAGNGFNLTDGRYTNIFGMWFEGNTTFDINANAASRFTDQMQGIVVFPVSFGLGIGTPQNLGAGSFVDDRLNTRVLNFGRSVLQDGFDDSGNYGQQHVISNSSALTSVWWWRGAGISSSTTQDLLLRAFSQSGANQQAFAFLQNSHVLLPVHAGTGSVATGFSTSGIASSTFFGAAPPIGTFLWDDVNNVLSVVGTSSVYHHIATTT